MITGNHDLAGFVTSCNRSINILEEFFEQVDSGALFACRQGEFLQKLRHDLRSALVRLLIWERPGLEASRGLSWPYQGFAERYHVFCDWAVQSADPFEGKQALLFLALLPFPEQWKWLLKAERLLRDDPEMSAFLSGERRQVVRKIAEKPQRTYKLRHFCQVLKKPGAGAKGVLRIFSLPYLFVFEMQLLTALSRRYVLYVEPPMGVVFRHAWWRYFSNLEDPCIMGVGSREDRKFFQTQAGVEAVPLAHGDYMEDLDGREWPLDGVPREYDVVFNATFDDMPRKRHQKMLELLRHPLLQDTRALFLGRGGKMHVTQFARSVSELGLASRVTLKANLVRSEIPAQLALCRVGVHLSLYENACRSIYEFFRSDLPCVIPSSMGGMNLSLFQGDTGLAVLEEDLPHAIAFALNNRGQFKPRQWFLNNSGSRHSSARLNLLLKKIFSAWGYAWREDIVPLGSSGASRYVHASDYEKFRSEFEWILQAFNAVSRRKPAFSLE